VLKRGTLVALAAAMALACVLVACGGDNDGASSSNGDCAKGTLEQATAPVEITFWHAMTVRNAETLQALVDQFNSSQTQVKVNLVFQGNYGETLDKYLTALRGEQLPDMVQLEDTATQLMIDSGSAVKMQDCLEVDNYDTSDHLERVLAFYTVDGDLWPMPFNVSNPIFYYNKTAFAKAGLDPNKPPTTLEEIEQYSRAIVDSGAAKHGFSFELSPWLIEQWFGMAGEEFVNNGNGRDARATEVLFNNDLGLEIFTWFKRMVDDGLAVNVGRNPSGADHFLAIGSGDSAMTIGTSAALGTIFQVLEGGDFPDVELAVAPLPGKKGDGGIVVGGAALYISNRSTPEKQEAARVFAEWLNEPEQQATWHEGSGYIPIRKSAAELPQVQTLWAEKPQYKVAYDQLLSGVTNPASAGPVLGPSQEMRDAVTKGLERMLLEGASPEDALSGAADEANAAIAEYNSRIGG
jgi:sn-glycerol 3-phosphate transport system substrate-binding protein